MKLFDSKRIKWELSRKFISTLSVWKKKYYKEENLSSLCEIEETL